MYQFFGFPNSKLKLLFVKLRQNILLFSMNGKKIKEIYIKVFR